MLVRPTRRTPRTSPPNLASLSFGGPDNKTIIADALQQLVCDAGVQGLSGMVTVVALCSWLLLK